MTAVSTSAQAPEQPLAATGIPGFDRILEGGLTSKRLYLVEGVPGSGKTTLAMQFLLEGARLGESVLYITLSETLDELSAAAVAHGWTLDGVTVHELAPTEETLDPEEQYTMFHPAEIELGHTTRSILAEVDRLKPSRVVLDSLSELRLLAGSPLRYRRQILALKQFFAGRCCTVLLLDDLTATDRDLQVQSIAHGVVALEQMNPEYGTERRRLRVVKLRGREYRGGYHDFVIIRGGLDVFPRLVAADGRQPSSRAKLKSGVAGIDRLLGGGLERGTSTLLVGGPGTGKSTLASSFLVAAAERGEKAALFTFDESLNTLFSRALGLGMDLRKHVDAGLLHIQQVDPAELSPGEFAHVISRFVEREHGTIVVIDSLNGYLNAMPDERYLVIQLHELLTYLGQRGVATLMLAAHQGLVGGAMIAPVDASYLADSVVLLRYYEAQGEVRQAISVLKNRASSHERTIREYRLGPDGISIGEPLRGFRGILTGVPVPEPQPPAGEGRASS
jgi:circadian clock protein KaiC